MKSRTILTLIGLIIFVAGCQTTRTVDIDPCPMPTGYKVGPAIATAEQTLARCPDRLDEVFMGMVAIAKHNPDKENAVLIREMLSRLSKKNLISEQYAKNIYNAYFSIRFTSLPDVKVYNLPAEIDEIKKSLREELRKKKAGLEGSCGDKEEYALAETEFSRLMNLMENLVINEEYLRGEAKTAW